MVGIQKQKQTGFQKPATDQWNWTTEPGKREPCVIIVIYTTKHNGTYWDPTQLKWKSEKRRPDIIGIFILYSRDFFFAAPFLWSSKWHAASCLMASRFLVFFLFEVVLARLFFPSFRLWIPKRCKGVHCVDLGESFPTSIYLQNLASIQPRTSPVKFANCRRASAQQRWRLPMAPFLVA